MTLIKFGKEQKIGIKEFDDQHKDIIDLVNQLYSIKDHEKKEILESLNILLEKLRFHFDREERFMKDHHVVQYISHKLEHDRALAKFADYYRGLKSSKSEFDTEILVSLKNWLENHLVKKDSKLQAFVTHN